MWQIQDITSKFLPKQVGHYKLGRRAGPLLFLSGQIAVDPVTGETIRGYDGLPEDIRTHLATGRLNVDTREGPIAAQTWYTWNLIKNLLEEQGSSLDHILFVTTYILDLDWFPTLDRVRNYFFPRGHPPGTILEVNELGMGKEILIEIEVVALIPQTGG